MEQAEGDRAKMMAEQEALRKQMETEMESARLKRE